MTYPNPEHTRIKFLTAEEVADLTAQGKVAPAVRWDGGIWDVTAYHDALCRQNGIDRGYRFLDPTLNPTEADIRAFIAANTINGIYTPPPMSDPAAVETVEAEPNRPRPGIDVPYTETNLRAIGHGFRKYMRYAEWGAKPGTPTAPSMLNGELNRMLDAMRNKAAVYYDSSVTHVPAQGTDDDGGAVQTVEPEHIPGVTGPYTEEEWKGLLDADEVWWLHPFTTPCLQVADKLHFDGVFPPHKMFRTEEACRKWYDSNGAHELPSSSPEEPTRQLTDHRLRQAANQWEKRDSRSVDDIRIFLRDPLGETLEMPVYVLYLRISIDGLKITPIVEVEQGTRDSFLGSLKFSVLSPEDAHRLLTRIASVQEDQSSKLLFDSLAAAALSNMPKGARQ